MIRCPACSNDAPEDSRFCPRCAAPLKVASDTPTRTSVPSEIPPPAAAPARRLTTDPSGGGRFLPGTVLSGRYRILGLLGRGGMGEVYRADDLKLGQAVALKFLPASVAKDEARLQRFLNEVKIARQISHPGVCRVYDVGEVDGHHFISMEYVDGEDLASLLRRIGRLPRDKAVQIARQLCAGLAAAHDQGVLHRDLKPANVMIDGRGRAKIADFGLAAIAEEIGTTEVGAGTPAYMAPEQLTGKGVSVRSDIYSLGLVLYEMFTGEPAFKATTPAELARLQEESAPTSPGRLVEGLDPTVERAILRCLEKEPRARPSSALAVAAALPGADPLAAALAVGEMPSPEMVADAGDAGGLRPWIAATCVGAIAVGIVVSVATGGANELILIAPPEKPPAALQVEAREIIAEAGYPEKPADSKYWLSFDLEHVKNIEERDSTVTRWEVLRTARPAPIRFYYRQSPRSLVTLGRDGFVTEEDPPNTVSGMISVMLDASGRLEEFQAVPPQLDQAEGPAPAVNWGMFFRRAGLREELFTQARAIWNPLIACDERRAWTGAYAEQPNVPFRVEAGSYRGKPVWFKVVPPWHKPWREQSWPLKPGERAAAIIANVLVAFVIGGAALLARRNLRLGRADRRGAFRLVAFVSLLHVVGGALTRHHVAEFNEGFIVFLAAALVLLISASIWLIYVALEPYARRLWPEVLISWNRLLAGRLRDPRIGRDVLIGGAAWAGRELLGLLETSANRWMGLAAPTPSASMLHELSGGGNRVESFLDAVTGALTVGIVYLFLVLLLRVILRRQWAAVGGVLLLAIVFGTLANSNQKFAWIFAALDFGTMLFVLMRFGLLASFGMILFNGFSEALPLLSHFPAWYAQPWVAELLAIAALAVYGFVISTVGRSLFPEDVLEAREKVRAP